MTNFLFSDLPIRAVIFDCDGTLVDSEEAHLASWRYALQTLGHDLTPEQCLQITGKPSLVIASLLAAEIGCNCAAQILTDKRAHYKKLHKKGLAPIEGTVDFVKRLAKEKERLHLKLGVASAAIKAEIIASLKQLGIEDLFDVILSGQEDLSDYSDPEGVNKPKPYIYLHAAKQLHVDPSECIVVEDSLTGVAAGKAAGCVTLAIPNRFTEAQDLSAANLRLETLSGMSLEAFFQLLCPRP